jgi:hypothetical protein
MNTPRLLLRCAPLLLLLTGALAQTPAPAPAPGPAAPLTPKPAAKSEWVFSILPKAFQKNPRVELTVITEMTELGKKQPVATPAQPVYYITQSSGFHQMGHAPSGERTLKPEEVERLLTKALAPNGFLPAAPPAHPATLVIFYTWGSHNLLVEGDADNPALSSQEIARNLLDRAALVGGVKFSQDMLKLFQEADDLATLNRVPPPDPTGAVPPIDPILGDAQMEFLNPINRYKQADPKHEFLFEQFTNDLYYVVASAYDYAAIARKEKRLYWRTRMTVAAQGVSQEQTLPTLIVSAAPYFGREMTEAEILTKRAVPDGKVEIGPATVVESGVPDPPPARAQPARP